MARDVRGALYTRAMRRLVLLAVVTAFAVAGTVTVAPASESGPAATAAKTPKLTKKQKKAKKSCLKRSSKHRYQLVKIVKKNGKRVGSYRCHKLTTDEVLAEQDAECANGQCAGTGEDDGEGDQPPIKL